MLFSVSCFAQSGNVAYLTFTTNNMAASSAVTVNQANILENVILSTTNAAGAIVYLFDGNTTNVTGVYTNVTMYSTNRVSTWVTTTGITNNMTNTLLYINSVVTAALTNNAKPVITIFVPPSSQIINLDTSLIFANKITLSNTATGLNASLFYRLP